MKWKLAVRANWIRDSSSGSMADSVPIRRGRRSHLRPPTVGVEGASRGPRLRVRPPGRGRDGSRRSARIEAIDQSGSLGGRQSMNEVEREGRGPAEPVGPEALAAERIEVLVEPQRATSPRLLRRIASASTVWPCCISPFQSSQLVLIQTGPRCTCARRTPRQRGRSSGRRGRRAGPVEAGRAEVGHDRGELCGRQVGSRSGANEMIAVLDLALPADDVERAEAAGLRSHSSRERRMDPLGVFAMRRPILPHDLGDLDERMRRPEVDRGEERTGRSGTRSSSSRASS